LGGRKEKKPPTLAYRWGAGGRRTWKEGPGMGFLESEGGRFQAGTGSDVTTRNQRAGL